MIKILSLLFFFVHLGLEAAEFVLFTQPKTGTHLLIPILTELTNKQVYWAPEYVRNKKLLERSNAKVLTHSEYFPLGMDCGTWNQKIVDLIWETNRSKGTFLHLHAPYSLAMEKYLQNKNCVNFFVKRDPRDQIISLMNHYKHIMCDNKRFNSLDSDDDKLLYLIKNMLKNYVMQYLNWLNSPACCVLDFAKLMGAHGGVATDEDALHEMRAIATALQLDVSDEYLEQIYRKCFGTGWSFFSGKVGSWKNYCNEEHKMAIKQEIGDLLIQLGYEKDFEW